MCAFGWFEVFRYLNSHYCNTQTPYLPLSHLPLEFGSPWTIFNWSASAWFLAASWEDSSFPINTTTAWNEDRMRSKEGKEKVGVGDTVSLEKKSPLLLMCSGRPINISSWLLLHCQAPLSLPPSHLPMPAKSWISRFRAGAVKSYWGTGSDSITAKHGTIFCGESLSSTWLSLALHITSKWHALSLGKNESFLKNWDFNNMWRKDEITFWGGEGREKEGREKDEGERKR